MENEMREKGEKDNCEANNAVSWSTAKHRKELDIFEFIPPIFCKWLPNPQYSRMQLVVQTQRKKGKCIHSESMLIC